MATIYILLGALVGIGTLIAVESNVWLFIGLQILMLGLIGRGMHLLNKEDSK
jgi:hypothetical protein